MQIPRWLKKIRATMPIVSNSHKVAHGENLPDWGILLRKESLAWSKAKENAQNEPNVLIATTVGG